MAGPLTLLAAGASSSGWLTLDNGRAIGLVILGLSVIVFVHELGHFLAAKWVGIRVDRFAVGFWYRVFGWRRGEGFTFGERPNYRPDELRERGFGETDYCFKILPIGGYVKMLGQEDFILDEKTGAIEMTKDPRAFPNHPIGSRMLVVSSGVVFNLIFAFLVYTGVFYMWGQSVYTPIVGIVRPDFPAQTAGIREGDRILALNGREVLSMEDVLKAAVYSDGPFRFQIERNGAVQPDEFIVEKLEGEASWQRLGINPAVSAQLAVDAPPLAAGDVIREIDGKPIDSGHDVMSAFLISAGRTLDVRVDRTDAKGGSQRLTFQVRPRVEILAAEVSTPTGLPLRDDKHILGLLPRRGIGYVEPGSRAESAGLRPGDVIAEIASIPHPTERELLETIRANNEKPIDVIVLRNQTREKISVTPREAIDPFEKSYAKIGVQFSEIDPGVPVVADVVDGWPAAEAKLPRGAEILSINDERTENWAAVFNALTRLAGQPARIRFRSGDNEGVGSFAVPGSVIDALNLAPTTAFVSVNGLDKLAETKDVTYSVASPVGLRYVMKHFAGQKVSVRYALDEGGPSREGEFIVKPDGSNADPWQFRVLFLPPTPPAVMGFKVLQHRITAAGNPLTAMKMALRHSYSQVEEVGLAIKRMTTRVSTTKHVSGPIGIATTAMQQAKAGWEDLLLFLAFMSANLAVINFLPLPVLDGGTMLLLIIEKFRGKPLKFDTQIWITLAGLVIIICSSLFAVFQDIRRLFGF